LVRPLLFLAPNENIIRQTSETEAKGGRLSAASFCPARTRSFHALEFGGDVLPSDLVAELA
jgi:hypothetical protein